MIRLVEMSEADYERFAALTVPGHAAERVKSGDWSQDEALDRARALFAQMLPEGRRTPGHTFYAVHDGDDGAVGSLWISEEQRGAERIVFVNDIFIDAPHRRRGLAEATFAALEAEARARGISGVSLHVFGHNEAARALYAKLGFAPTSLYLYKRFDRLGP